MNLYQKQYIDPEEIPFALAEAFAYFNDEFGTEYSTDNVKIGFFTFQTFPSVFRKFCENDFPTWLYEDYENPNYCIDAQSMALVEGSNAGILINISKPFSFVDWIITLIHEIAHIYAAQTEYGGKNFYRECCCDADLPSEEDMLYIGYSVWKEFIADYLTSFTSIWKLKTLYQYRGEIKRFDAAVTNLKPNSLKAIELVLVAIFTSKEHFAANSKEEFIDILEKKTVLNMDEYRDMIKLIFDHIHNERTAEHVINDEFIDELGSHVRKIVIDREFRRFTNNILF